MLAIMVGVLALGPMSVGAAEINFDDLAVGNINGVTLGVGIDRVTITSGDGTAAVFNGDQFGMGYLSKPNTISNDGYVTSSPLVFTFAVPRGFVRFYGGDEGGDTDRFFVDFYDKNNNLLLTHDSGVFGGNPLDPLNSMVDDHYAAYWFNDNPALAVKKMVVRNAINAGIVIDNLGYCHPQTAIPGTLLLLGSGLLGVVGLRRRLS
jgi:hypothetical protein